MDRHRVRQRTEVAAAPAQRTPEGRPATGLLAGRPRVHQEHRRVAKRRLHLLERHPQFFTPAAGKDRGCAVFLARLRSFKGVPGRMERIEEGQPFNVLVDYAHTDDALRNALGMLRASLSARGLKLSQDIMRLNHTLGELNNNDFDQYGDDQIGRAHV